MHVKLTNEVYARHLLATRRQQPAETLDEYLQALQTLSKDCNYQSATTVLFWDAFITGLTSGLIRQRLLENKTLDLKTMFDQARSLESAARSSESYSVQPPPFNAAVPPVSKALDPPIDPATLAAASVMLGQKFFFCGYSRHPRSNALLMMQHVLTARRGDTFRKFVMGVLLHPWQRGCRQ